MPGGFHPFHAGHASLYQSAVKSFPGADVYVAATNDTKTRPFPFEIKEKLAKVAGVQDGRFVQVTSPFQSKEILQNYNPEEDVVVFVRSEKDRNEQPKPGGTKKDGSPAYFQPYTGKDMQPFGKHGYMAYLPTVEFGPGIKSATEIRNIWPQLNDRRKLAMVMSLYPKAKENEKLAQNIVKMLDLGMGTEEVNETGRPYNPDGKTYRGTKNKMPTLGPDPAQDAEPLSSLSGSYEMDELEQSIDSSQLLKLVTSKMSNLTPREEYVVRARFGLAGEEEKTLDQIGEIIGISGNRVRQIEAKAIRKLRQFTTPGWTPAPQKVKDPNIAAEIEKLKLQWQKIKDKERELYDTHDDYRIPSETMKGAYSISPKWYAKERELVRKKKAVNAKIKELQGKLFTLREAKMNEKAGDVYSARQARIFKDLGDGYFLGDDSYDDDDGFTKEGYTVYYQEGTNQYRQVDTVNMSPYSNPPGHIENEIEKLIANDSQSLVTENAQAEKIIESAFDWSDYRFVEDMDTRLAITEAYFTSKMTLTESNDPDMASYFTSLSNMSDHVKVGKKCILVPLVLLSNKVSQIQFPEIVKLTKVDNEFYTVERPSGITDTYPKTRDKGNLTFITMMFNKISSYNKFRTAVMLKFESPLPDSDLIIRPNTNTQTDDNITESQDYLEEK
jgi:RNA polymerase primary sigma factor